MRKTTSFTLALFAAAALTSGTAVARTESAASPAAAAAANHAAQIHRVEVASSVYELAYSEKQQALFVATPAQKDGETSKVLRLHPQTLAVQAEIVLPYKGFGVALDDAAGRLYVGHGFDGAASVIDIATNKVLATIALVHKKEGAEGHDAYTHSLRELVVDAKHNRLYLPGLSAKESALYVVDTQTLKLEKVISGFGFQATGIALDDRRGRVFVSNMQGQVITVDAATLAIMQTHEIEEADQLLNLIYDADTNRLIGTDQGINRNAWRNKNLERNYVPRGDGHQAIVLDADTGKLLAKVATDKYPHALQLDTQRKRLYVSNFNAIRAQRNLGTLTVFDSDSYHRLQTIALPPMTNSMAFDAKNNVLFLTIKNDGSSTHAGKKESVARIQF